MKKIISTILAALIVTSSLSALARENFGRDIILCYDSAGKLVYSRLVKEGEDKIVPQEFKDTEKKIYSVDKETFEELKDTEEDTTGDSYVQKLMASMPQDSNFVISPLSLKMAMMLAANGAEGETQKEILDAFDITDLKEYNEKAKELMEDSVTYGYDYDWEKDKEIEVETSRVDIANSIWYNTDYYPGIKDDDFSKDYKETVSNYYNGRAEKVENKNSVEKVNEWVSDKTQGKIQNLIGNDQREFLLALVNAVYMKARWASPFMESGTYKETFTDIEGKKTDTDFMHQTDKFMYGENGDTKILKLPYDGNLSMYIVLGDSKNFKEDMANMTYEKVSVSIPKFKTEFSVELNDALKEMGVSKAFTNMAEFEPMLYNVPDGAKIDTVLQKAMIDVDENGTEAAAATFIGLAAGSAMTEPEKIYEFKADKPFTYYITDDDEILFAGRYAKCE